MNDKPDQHGLDLFDRKASAVGGFPNAMLGYDKKAVDDYIRDLENEANVAKHQLEEVRRELIAANLRIDDTDFGRLGTHTASMLQVAEAQAAEILNKARTRAQTILSDAQDTAEKIKAQATQGAEQARLDAVESLQGLRAELSEQTEAELNAVRSESEGIRSAAESHREYVLSEAQREADALLDQARTGAQRIKAEMDKQVADTSKESPLSARAHAEIAAEKERVLRELEEEQATAQQKLSELTEQTRVESEEYQATLTTAAEEFRQRQQISLAEAESIKVGAVEEAQAILAKARSDADLLLSEADGELIRRREKLRHDSHLLRERKLALISQLKQLSSIANVAEEEYPDEVTGPIETSGAIPDIQLDELFEDDFEFESDTGQAKENDDLATEENEDSDNAESQ